MLANTGRDMSTGKDNNHHSGRVKTSHSNANLLACYLKLGAQTAALGCGKDDHQTGSNRVSLALSLATDSQLTCNSSHCQQEETHTLLCSFNAEVLFLQEPSEVCVRRSTTSQRTPTMRRMLLNICSVSLKNTSNTSSHTDTRRGGGRWSPERREEMK